jgi:hypothetical protein
MLHGTKMKILFINMVFSLLVHVPTSAFQTFLDQSLYVTKETRTCLQDDVYRSSTNYNRHFHFRRAFRSGLSFGRRAVCNLSRAVPVKRKYPPIPLITTFEKNVLLPGESLHVDMPSPGTVTAISVAKAFVSVHPFPFCRMRMQLWLDLSLD